MDYHKLWNDLYLMLDNHRKADPYNIPVTVILTLMHEWENAAILKEKTLENPKP